MFVFAISCDAPENKAREITQMSSELVKDQNEAMQDSTFTEQEISALVEQRKRISEKMQDVSQNLTTKQKKAFCNAIQNDSYDLIKSWESSNYNLFYNHNASDYISKSQSVELRFFDCEAWQKLASHMFMQTIQVTAQKAMADQFILARKQIKSARDNYISDQEIEDIITAFKNSLSTYQSIQDRLAGNEDMLDTFEKELNEISKRYKAMNENQAAQLTDCENYNKLSKAMFEAMYSKE
jgi:hypothetical protein